MSNRNILLDTNIVSTFSKIQDLEFLFQITGQDILQISSSVLHELEEAKGYGFDFITPIFDLVEAGKIEVICMDKQELKWSMNLPDSFGLGERDSIAICKHRKGIFITNERKVINFCQRNNIPAINLPSILRKSWKRGVRTKDQVNTIILEIETKDKIVFKNKELILKD